MMVLSTSWIFTREADLKYAIHGRGLGLGFDFEEITGSGYLWQRPASLCFVYAYDAEDGIHVPFLLGEKVVQTVEEATELIRKLVLDEFGEAI